MLDDIRTKVRGPWAIAIVLLISVPFIMFGVESIFSIGSGAGASLSVNDRDFPEQYIEQLVQQQAQQGQQDTTLVRQEVIEQLIDRTLFEQLVEKMKLTLSNDDVDKSIASDPQFSQNGQFSQQALNNYLRASGMSGQYYRDSVRTDLAINQLGSVFSSAEFVTPAEVQTNIALFEQTRDATVYKLSLEQELQKVNLQEEDKKSFYEENKSAFMTEEQVVLNYIELDKSQFSATATEQEIEQRYKQEVATLNKQSQRRISHIMLLLNDKPATEKVAEMQKIRQQIVQGGATFESLAKTKSEDSGTQNSGGDLGYAQLSAFPPAFAEAASQLNVDEISEPVVTDSGVHLIKVTEVKAAPVPEFAANAERIKQEIIDKKVTEQFQVKLERLVDISFNAEDLTEPAKALNVQIKTTKPFGRLSAYDDVTSNPKLLNGAFSDDALIQKNNSDVIEIDSTQYVVYHVKEHLSSQQKPYQEVSNEVATMLKRSQAIENLSVIEEQVKADIEKGEAAGSLAAKYGLSVESVKALSMNAQDSDLASVVRKTIFEASKPAANKLSLETVRDKDDLYIVSVNAVNPGSSSGLSEQDIANAQGVARQFDGLYLQAAFRKFLRDNAKIRIKDKAAEDS